MTDGASWQLIVKLRFVKGGSFMDELRERRLAELKAKFIVDSDEARLCLARKVPVKSPCHRNSKIVSSLGDGVLVGSCEKCGANLLRINPRTGKQEWLHGASPWTSADALR